MGLCFYVSSITNAMRGKSILEQNNIRAFINRSHDECINNGCGYCIIVTSDFEKAERLLRSIGIRIRDQKYADDMP
ncbi:MAG: DUF3343 domain-containing protein [Oscillospiraceae bacterium]|nr:DUF3343 domain-containing protein [Oscillospiraceae bacterium]